MALPLKQSMNDTYLLKLMLVSFWGGGGGKTHVIGPF